MPMATRRDSGVWITLDKWQTSWGWTAEGILALERFSSSSHPYEHWNIHSYEGHIQSLTSKCRSARLASICRIMVLVAARQLGNLIMNSKVQVGAYTPGL